MKTKTAYQMRKAEEREVLPEIDLIPIIPHENEQLNIALFGADTYNNNIQSMHKRYFHSKEFPNISFSPVTTAESISAASYRFRDFAKPQIFDPKWLQAGWIVRTSEGVFVNPPKDEQGNIIIDEKTLKGYLDNTTKVNGIYKVDNGKLEGIRDFSFVPYESFNQGVQSREDFARSGLARGLEHVNSQKAPKFELISSKENYPEGVNVWGFDSVKEPALRVAGLGSGGGFSGDWLVVDGNDWGDDSNGFAFGVCEARTK